MTINRRTLLVLVVALSAAILPMLLLSGEGSASNVTISTSTTSGHITDEEPEYFYLFNTTTRRYEDTLQWDAGSNSISMRCVNGTLTYKPYGNWMGLYLNDTIKVVSYWSLQDLKGVVLPTKGTWEFIDRGETLVMRRYAVKGLLNVTEEWEFAFKMGDHPKLTFEVVNTGPSKYSLDWSLEVPRRSIPKSTSYNTTTVKSMVVGGFIEVDWSDYPEKVHLTADSSEDKLTIRFQPDGALGNFTIDPSVGFSTTQMTDVCWVQLCFQNPQNPANPSEVVHFEDLSWIWYDATAPGTEIAVDCNPFPVPNGVNVYVKVYDAWGRSWLSASIATGAPGTYTRVEGTLPVCWISVQCWNGVRADGFHRWAIRTIGGSTWLYIDEPVKFPVVVDDSNTVDWNVWVPEDSWIEDAGNTTVSHADLSGRREYVVNFNITLKREPTTVYIRVYDDQTGEGVPWERFIVRWDGVVTPTNVIQAWTNESHTAVVEDFWGNELNNTTVSSWDAPVHLLAIPVATYSVKAFNQNPNYVHKISLYYNLTDGPYVFYIAPLEIVELHLKAADYRFKWTPYRDYVAQATQQFDLTVSGANYFLIDGVTILRVISDVQGVYALQQVITSFVRPDLVAVATELPRAPCRDQFGEVRFIHPWAVVTADLSYNLTGTSLLLWTPHPDAAGLNYTVARDRLYFSGTYSTTVRVNWTSNGTTRFNLTTLPASLDLGDGGNYTLWASNPLDVTREVTFRQSELFYWSYFTSERRYEVDVSFNNSMNLTWTDVNFMVGWAENRTMDLPGVRVYDVQNGIYLTHGEHFDVTQGGLYFYFPNVSAGSLRTFTITAWDANTTGVYDTPSITCTDYATEAYRGQSTFYCAGTWTNTNPVPYTGSLIISFKFDRDVNDASVVVYDVRRGRELRGSEWTFIGKGVLVHSPGVGTIGVGHTASYKVYFRLAADQEEASTMFGTAYFGLTPWTWLLLLSIGFTVGAAYGSRRRSSRGSTQALVLGSTTLWSIVAITWILHSMGAIS